MMSVMTLSHTVSYEQAHWTDCENAHINTNICKFQCVFNKPDNYEIIKGKYATLPGNRMSRDQQAKLIRRSESGTGIEERPDAKYDLDAPVDTRCLYFYSIQEHETRRKTNTNIFKKMSKTKL